MHYDTQLRIKAVELAAKANKPDDLIKTAQNIYNFIKDKNSRNDIASKKL